MSAASGAMYMDNSRGLNAEPCGTPVSGVIRRAGSPFDERSTGTEIRLQPIQRCTCECAAVGQSTLHCACSRKRQTGRGQLAGRTRQRRKLQRCHSLAGVELFQFIMHTCQNARYSCHFRCTAVIWISGRNTIISWMP